MAEPATPPLPAPAPVPPPGGPPTAVPPAPPPAALLPEPPHYHPLNRPYAEERPEPPIVLPRRGLAVAGIAGVLLVVLAVVFWSRLRLEYLVWKLATEEIRMNDGVEKPLSPVAQEILSYGPVAVPRLVRTLDAMDLARDESRFAGNDRAVQAMDLLLRARPPEALPPLLERLQHPNPSTRYWAAVMVGHLGDERNLTDLRAAYEREKHPEVQRRLAVLRLRFGDREVVPLLIEAMKDPAIEEGEWGLQERTWGVAFYRDLVETAGMPADFPPDLGPLPTLPPDRVDLFIQKARAWWDANRGSMQWDRKEKIFTAPKGK